VTMIDCIFTGDIMPGARVMEETPDPGLQAQFREADLVVGNLECPFVSAPPKAMDLRKIPLWSNAVNARVLDSFSFTHVGLNNNHIFDLFEPGLDETMRFLNDRRVRGFGIEYKGLSQYCRTTMHGVTLGMAAVNWVEARFSGHLFKDLAALDIGSFKKECDFLVMFLHWGDDHNIFVNRDQQEAGRWLIDQGADLVIGHHPHVPQGYEVYKGKYIFYSLGNFIFTSREEYEDLPYDIRYEDGRENVLFQRAECKIGLYVRVLFDGASYRVVDIRPVYRTGTLPAALPGELQSFFDELMERMNDQVRQSIYEWNETERRKILARYTLPFILKHPVFWPVFFKKASIEKVSGFVSRGRIVSRWKK